MGKGQGALCSGSERRVTRATTPLLSRLPQVTGSVDNYTRAYFADGGASIVSGSCEEAVVRWHSSTTGELQARGLDGGGREIE